MSTSPRAADSRDPAPLFPTVTVVREASIPQPGTPLFGRDDVLAAVVALLRKDDVPILTLTGPGGVGKTRIALQAASDLIDASGGSVVLVDLAPLTRADQAPLQIARQLGLPNTEARMLEESLASRLRDRRTLLVLDNFEHVLPAAPLVAHLSSACPQLTILVTSRARLGISNERIYPVAPLEIEPAMRLFEERAQRVSPTFELSDEVAQPVAAICNRLDRLPLAIELAAARTDLLPPRAMLARLDHALALLSAGALEAPRRQRTMRDTIAWSYELLGLEDQALFRRLGVFAGGFTLESAGAVGGNGEDAFDGVARLLAGSLVVSPGDHRSEPRFRMLETVREYALEQLHAAGEDRAARQLHAEHFVRLADLTERLWWTKDGAARLEDMEPDVQNFQIALEWLQRTGDVESLLHLAGCLGPLWATRGYTLAGQTWLEWGLARSDQCSPYSVIIALRGLAWILNQHGDFYRSLLIAEQSLSLSRGDADGLNLAASHMLCGNASFGLGYYRRAIVRYLGALLLAASHPSEPWSLVARCMTMCQLGKIAMAEGAIARAESWYSQALAVQQSLGAQFTFMSRPTIGIGEIARARGDPRGAVQTFQTALPMSIETKDVRSIVDCLASIAGGVAAIGTYERGARLFGSAEAFCERIGRPFPLLFNLQRAYGLPEPWAGAGCAHGVAEPLFQTLEAQTAAIRAVTLDATMARHWWDEGRALSLDDAIALALIPISESEARPARPGGLSPREFEVLRLVAQGKPDREIASRLFISPRTVQNHLQHIYDKLGVSSRAAATAWAIRRGFA